jgi:hypothetical protein
MCLSESERARAKCLRVVVESQRRCDGLPEAGCLRQRRECGSVERTGVAGGKWAEESAKVVTMSQSVRQRKGM